MAGAWLGHGGYSVTPHIIFCVWGKGSLRGQGSGGGSDQVPHEEQVFLWVSNKVYFLPHFIITIVAISVWFFISLLFPSKLFISQPMIFTFCASSSPLQSVTGEGQGEGRSE